MLSGRTDGASILRYCREVKSELELAIASGEINAGQPGFGFLPPLRPQYLLQIPIETVRSMSLLVTKLSSFQIGRAKVNPGDIEEIMTWHEYLKAWPKKMRIEYLSLI